MKNVAKIMAHFISCFPSLALAKDPSLVHLLFEVILLENQVRKSGKSGGAHKIIKTTIYPTIQTSFL